MMHLGLPVPVTWMVPPCEYDVTLDLQATLVRYARLFDLGELGRRIGYPLFLKPYDGNAWVGVSRIGDEETLHAAYRESGKRVMHLQESVEGFDLFVRCLGVGPQVRIMKYDPGAALHDRYKVAFDIVDAEDAAIARRRPEVERFEEFCAEYLAHFDLLAWEFFGTDVAHDALRQKVEALFPAHEHERFIAHFWGLIQFWRKIEADRLGITGDAASDGAAPRQAPPRSGA